MRLGLHWAGVRGKSEKAKLWIGRALACTETHTHTQFGSQSQPQNLMPLTAIWFNLTSFAFFPFTSLFKHPYSITVVFLFFIFFTSSFQVLSFFPFWIISFSFLRCIFQICFPAWLPPEVCHHSILYESWSVSPSFLIKNRIKSTWIKLSSVLMGKLHCPWYIQTPGWWDCFSPCVLTGQSAVFHLGKQNLRMCSTTVGQKPTTNTKVSHLNHCYLFNIFSHISPLS